MLVMLLVPATAYTVTDVVIQVGTEEKNIVQSRDLLTVEATVSGTGIASLKLYNAKDSTQVLSNDPGTFTGPAKWSNIDISTLAPGSYSAIVSSDNSASAFFTVKAVPRSVSVPDLPPGLALLVLAGIFAIAWSKSKTVK